MATRSWVWFLLLVRNACLPANGIISNVFGLQFASPKLLQSGKLLREDTIRGNRSLTGITPGLAALVNPMTYFHGSSGNKFIHRSEDRWFQQKRLERTHGSPYQRRCSSVIDLY